MKLADLLPGLPQGAKILFIRLRSLGDTLLSTPLYAALKAWRPDLRLCALVESPNDEVLRNNPDLDAILSIPASAKSSLGRLAARWNVLGEVRAARFDCCINLHGGSTSAWLTALSGARHRAGPSTFRNRFAYDLHIETPLATSGSGTRRLHTVEHQMQWLRALGLPEAPTPPLRLVPDPRLRPGVRNKLLAAGLDPARDYAVIHPASKFYTKEWTATGFAETADHLKMRHGIQVVLVGGPGEGAKIEQVAIACGNRPIVAPPISISELAWVIDEARIFIGNDSGPTHMAAALQIPIVVLFGSSDSRVWYPWQTPCQIVQNPFDCNPCPGYRCLVYDQPRCILSITPSQVKAAIDALLKVAS